MDIKNICIIFILFLICIFIILFNNKRKIETFESNKNSLNDKVVLITGSSKGFGFELAKLLNNHNCKLIIVGKSEKSVKTAEEELKKKNENVKGLVADFTNEDDIYTMMQNAINTFKKIDIVINMPIITKGSRYLTSKDIKDWKRELTINFDSIFLINQIAIKHMKNKKIHGRIINITTISAKHNSTTKSSGTDILTKNMVEKYTNMMAEENFKDNIALCVVRLDEKIGSSTFDKIKLNLPNQAQDVISTFKSFDFLVNATPRSVISLLLYCIKAPFHEISGKVVSSKAYETDNKLSKIVPSHNLKMKQQFYDRIIYPPNHNEKEYTYLVKQNPFGPSPSVKKIISNKYSFKKLNNNTKYENKISNIISKDLKIDKDQINFFKTEYDALKKIFEIFVPKYQEIVAQYPCWSLLYLLTKELKIDAKYLLMKENKGSIQPHLMTIKEKVSPKTKLLYLSSPNSVSGQHLKTAEFERYLADIPDNVIILIDQRYIDFATDTKTSFDPLKYLDRNVVVLRSFNNFYGIENLEQAYLIANKEISKFISETVVINQVTKFDDDIMCAVYKDKAYYNKIRRNMQSEKQRMYEILSSHNLNFFKSSTYYLLIETNDKKASVKKKLEKEKIVLYESNDGHNTYWTLPLSTIDTNNKVIDVISD